MTDFNPFRRNRTIRRETKAIATKTGELVPLESDIMSETPDGGIDYLHVDTEPRFYAVCLCTIEKPIGGQCYFGDCREVSCTEHFKHCQGSTWGIPLCKQHTYTLDVDGEVRLLCPRCHEKERPKLLAIVGKAIFKW